MDQSTARAWQGSRPKPVRWAAQQAGRDGPRRDTAPEAAQHCPPGAALDVGEAQPVRVLRRLQLMELSQPEIRKQAHALAVDQSGGSLPTLIPMRPARDGGSVKNPLLADSRRVLVAWCTYCTDADPYEARKGRGSVTGAQGADRDADWPKYVLIFFGQRFSHFGHKSPLFGQRCTFWPDPPLFLARPPLFLARFSREI